MMAATAIVVSPVAASASQRAGADAGDPRPRIEAARDLLLDARAGYLAATASATEAEAVSSRAEGAVKEVERQLVDATLELLAAQRSVGDAQRALAGTEEVHRLAVAQLREARSDLGTQVAESWKFGGPAAQGELALQVMRSVHDPNELARGLYLLDSVVGGQQQEVEDTEAVVGLAAQQVGAAEVALAAAEIALEAARTRVVGLETEAAALRVSADAAESVVLLRWTAAMDAEAELRHVVHRAPTRLAPIARRLRPDADDGADAALARRRRWLSSRGAALTAARSLPAADRRTRSDWGCPADGGTFTNDFHLPRSTMRRHEGLDVFAPTGTPVRALTHGRVTVVDREEGGDLGGITVSYASADRHWYLAHLASVAEGVAAGRRVRPGDVLGYVGNTGNARGTPPHLHLGFYVDDIAVNPFASVAVACQRPDVRPGGAVVRRLGDPL